MGFGSVGFGVFPQQREREGWAFWRGLGLQGVGHTHKRTLGPKPRQGVEFRAQTSIASIPAAQPIWGAVRHFGGVGFSPARGTGGVGLLVGSGAAGCTAYIQAHPWPQTPPLGNVQCTRAAPKPGKTCKQAPTPRQGVLSSVSHNSSIHHINSRRPANPSAPSTQFATPSPGVTRCHPTCATAVCSSSSTTSSL